MVLDRVLSKSKFREKKSRHAQWNQAKSKPTWRGIGLATVFHGAGFTGSGEVFLRSRAGLEAEQGRHDSHRRSVDRDRSGHDDDPCADRRGHARRSLRLDRG